MGFMWRAADGVPWVSVNRMQLIIPAIFDATHHLLWLTSPNVTSPTFRKRRAEPPYLQRPEQLDAELRVHSGAGLRNEDCLKWNAGQSKIRRRNLINPLLAAVRRKVDLSGDAA